MIFIAEIVKGSYVERDWLRRRMLGGIFGGVYFHKAFNQFVSDPLNEDQMTNIQDHPAVKISVMSNPDPELVPTDSFVFSGRGESVSEECDKVLTEKRKGRPKKGTE